MHLEESSAAVINTICLLVVVSITLITLSKALDVATPGLTQNIVGLNSQE